MSHPDPNGPPDRRPIKVGEVWENPVTGERSVILERPWENLASRMTGELTALIGARVMGEHRHPALVEQFTVLEGALSTVSQIFRPSKLFRRAILLLEYFISETSSSNS